MIEMKQLPMPPTRSELDFFSWANDLEKENLSPVVGLKEWIKIFPEAKSYLKQKKQKLEKEIENLRLNIFESLKKINDNYKKFDRIFWLEFQKVFFGNELKRKKEEVKEIEKAFFRPNPAIIRSKKSWNERVQKVKKINFEEVFDVNRFKWMLCPAHDDHRPSLYVKNQHAFCFVCNFSGDIIEVVRKKYNLGFKEAVEFLEKNYL